MSDAPIQGIFFESKEMKVGTMGTSRTHAGNHDLHYFVKENKKGEIDLFYLKPDGKPTAIVMDTITKDEFTKRFKDCSAHACEFKPKSAEDKKKEAAEKKVSVAEKHFEKKEFHAAAFEYGQAVKADNTNIKAHLGKGKAHMCLGEVDKAMESFENLSKIDTLYEKENKHLFNEYGIELRKGQMYDLAIENYAKAISIDPEDEALYFNMARACHEKGDTGAASNHLAKALEINPDFQEAKLLYNAIANAPKK